MAVFESNGDLVPEAIGAMESKRAGAGSGGVNPLNAASA